MTSNLKSFFRTNMLQVRSILTDTLVSYVQKKLVMSLMKIDGKKKTLRWMRSKH